jgi:hypothetical protein
MKNHHIEKDLKNRKIKTNFYKHMFYFELKQLAIKLKALVAFNLQSSLAESKSK